MSKITALGIVAFILVSGCGGGGEESATSEVQAAAATSSAGRCVRAPVVYTSRSEFLAAVRKPLTDTYGVGYESMTYTDAGMTAVRGETRYEAITFPNQNIVVANNFWTGEAADDPSTFAYCAGCNGNFKLHFNVTSRSVKGLGVPSVGLDVVLHTSRRISRGDGDPSEPSLPGSVLVEFGDGQTMQLTVPPDIGHFEPQTYFLGLSDKRLIRSITIGTEPTELRHFWIIDNLTIAGAAHVPCSDSL